ncbi:MAG: DedA family protein [candidate division Zixibacteria bacterium]|nr:DedA family protein [candidate division Zixibacteria bacterium]
MSESVEHINLFLDQLFRHGPWLVYAVLFAACFLENLFPPFPGDSFIAAAGALAAAGRLNFPLALLVVIAGGMTSVMLIYIFGRNYGRDYFLRKNYRYFSAGDVLLMEDRLRKWGMLVVLGSRFAVGLRSVLALVAGVARYDSIRMFVFSAVSYLAFSLLLMYLAASVVRNFDEIEQIFVTYNRIVLPIIGAGIVIFVGHRFWLFHRKKRS